MYGLLADLTVLAHASFVLFATGGGLLVRRWPRLAWLHLPALVWAVGIEWAGAICPLTYLEGWLRQRAGGLAGEGDFIERFVLWWLYPVGLTREVQVALGVSLLVLNLFVYGRWLRRRRRPRGRAAS